MPKLKGEKGKPIAGLDAMRDSSSGAVVFNSSHSYQKAVKLKRAGKRINNQENTIKSQDKVIRNNRRRIKKLEKKLDEVLAFLGNKPNGKRDIN